MYPCFLKRFFNFCKNQTKVGESVDLDIVAAENSEVFLLAVDKSVQLLASGNDVTERKLLELMQKPSQERNKIRIRMYIRVLKCLLTWVLSYKRTLGGHGIFGEGADGGSRGVMEVTQESYVKFYIYIYTAPPARFHPLFSNF